MSLPMNLVKPCISSGVAMNASTERPDVSMLHARPCHMMFFLSSITNWTTKPTALHGTLSDHASSDERLGLLGGGNQESNHDFAPIGGPIDPHLYYISPLQRWVTPLMRLSRNTGSFEAENLPRFSKDSRRLRNISHH